MNPVRPVPPRCRRRSRPRPKEAARQAERCSEAIGGGLGKRVDQIFSHWRLRATTRPSEMPTMSSFLPSPFRSARSTKRGEPNDIFMNNFTERSWMGVVMALAAGSSQDMESLSLHQDHLLMLAVAKAAKSATV